MKFQPLQLVTVLNEVENTISISEEVDFTVGDKRIGVETEVPEIANLGVLEENVELRYETAGDDLMIEEVSIEMEM